MARAGYAKPISPARETVQTSVAAPPLAAVPAVMCPQPRLRNPLFERFLNSGPAASVRNTARNTSAILDFLSNWTNLGIMEPTGEAGRTLRLAG